MINRFLNRFTNLILLFLCILPLSALIIDSFALLTDKSFMLWAAALCLLMWLAANFRHGFFPGFLLAGLLVYLAYRFYQADLRLELTDFFDRITGVYYEHYYARAAAIPMRRPWIPIILFCCWPSFCYRPISPCPSPRKAGGSSFLCWVPCLCLPAASP